MDISTVAEITINEYRSILKAIKEVHEYDFNDFALTSFKRRIERFITINRFISVETLIAKLQNDPDYFNYFIKEVLVQSTEMFRDPSYWRYLRDHLLPQLLKNKNKPTVCFPNCVSGNELFSFCIILKENNWLDHFQISAVYFNELILDSIKQGKMDASQYEISAENYQRFQGKSDFSSYFKKNGENLIRDIALIEQVAFIKQNTNFDYLPQNNDLIIFRNQLIYYSQPMHDRILKNIYRCLNPNGFLAIGIKEQIGIICQPLFKTVNEQESVYTKN